MIDGYLERMQRRRIHISAQMADGRPSACHESNTGDTKGEPTFWFHSRVMLEWRVQLVTGRLLTGDDDQDNGVRFVRG